jgi:SRSO17 transposase
MNSRHEGWARGLLVRRSVDEGQQQAYYRVFAPVGTRLKERVAVAGKRWAVEECFAAAQGECGLDEYEGRNGTGWHRHVTLALLAHADLTVLRAQALGETPPKKKTPRKKALMALSVPEIQRLLGFLLWQKTLEQSFVLTWSVWRRQHQAQAQFYHYQRRNRSG